MSGPTKSDYAKDNLAPKVTTALWNQGEISEVPWNKTYPYQLILVEAQVDGKVIQYVPTKYIYTLPITPQEFQIDMPIATNVQATITGIVEQHGGAPFRNITIKGTTGVAPDKGQNVKGREANPVLAFAVAVFAGTAGAARRVSVPGIDSQQFSNLNSDKPGGGPEDIKEHSTGYYQYRLLERFLESYVTWKSKGGKIGDGLDFDSKHLRLALAVWKDEAVYLCSGVQLSRVKNATSPHRITFTLNLKAWGRVALKEFKSEPFAHDFIGRNPNLLAAAHNRFRASRENLRALSDVLFSVISDPLNTIHEILRTVGLSLKDGAGIGAKINDFGRKVEEEALELLKKDWERIAGRFDGSTPEWLKDEFRREAKVFSSGGSSTSAFSKGIAQVNKGTNNGSSTGAANWGMGLHTFESNGGTAAFSRDREIDAVLGQLDPNELKFSPTARQQMAAERTRVRNFTRYDFEIMRDKMREASDTFALAVGCGSAKYAETFGHPAPTAIREPSRAEWDVLFALNEAIAVLDSLSASGTVDSPAPTSMEYVAGLAERSGIAFRVPRSKFAVPFPYGSTLEKLSVQYLGSANRWHEIATLNGLRQPYIDEEGFAVRLQSNGDRNEVTVADSAKFYIGQTVWLSANGVRREKRHVMNVERITATTHILTLDGKDDLERFTLPNLAQIEGFLPGTVNSRQVIYIPSDNAGDIDPKLKEIPGVDAFDPLLQVGGIDLLLTQDGDLAITPDGDVRLAYGLTNIVQTVKLALSTPRGALLQHPTYGLNLPVGISSADLDAQQLLSATQDMFNNDSAFSGVRSASVVQEGNTVRITVEVVLAGSGTFLPITIQVNR